MVIAQQFVQEIQSLCADQVLVLTVHKSLPPFTGVPEQQTRSLVKNKKYSIHFEEVKLEILCLAALHSCFVMTAVFLSLHLGHFGQRSFYSLVIIYKCLALLTADFNNAFVFCESDYKEGESSFGFFNSPSCSLITNSGF